MGAAATASFRHRGGCGDRRGRKVDCLICFLQDQRRTRPVKHATAATLQALSDLLDQIRAKEGIKEKKFGIFYRKSKSFLHFHEDPAGLFADLSVGADFDRYSVNTKQEWKVLLRAIDRALDGQ
jgi:hypothetical protein